MRDLAVKRSSKPTKATFEIDAAFVDEATSDPNKVQEMVEKVTLLTEQIISPTLASGDNTRLLIALFHKLQKLKQPADEECRMKISLTATELRELNDRYLKIDQESETGQKLCLIVLAELGRIQCYQTYGTAIENHQSNLQKMVTELFKLLKRQQKFGSEFMTNPEHLEFLATTYRTIEELWKEFRKAYVVIQKEEPEVANMEQWQGELTTNNRKFPMQTIRDYKLELGLFV